MSKNKAIAEAGEVAWKKEADRRAELESLSHSLKILEAERKSLDQHFVKGSNVVPLLNMIDALGPKTGATVKVSVVDLLKDQGKLTVEVRTGGRFEQIYKFLRLLETSPYELELTSVNIAQASVADEDGNPIPAGWQGTFRIKVLSFVP